MDVRLTVVVVNRVRTSTDVVRSYRTPIPGLLGFPQDLNALTDKLFPRTCRYLLDSGSALGTAWSQPAGGTWGCSQLHGTRAQARLALKQRTHGVCFRGGGLGLGLRDDDAFFLAGVRRVATIGLSCLDIVPLTNVELLLTSNGRPLRFRGIRNPF